MKNRQLKLYPLFGILVLLTSCGSFGTNIEIDETLVQGPPIKDIVTPFDQALICLKGRISRNVTFGVGAILDQTGKEQFTEGGAGKFITQGAGDIVQSALFKSGVTVLNRRDPRIMDTELKWGLRNKSDIVRSNFFLTGSINTLDFLPGGGAYISASGGGPEYRHHRILVGLDLSLTETKTGRIVANVPLQKQIVASENRLGLARFFGDVLVEIDIGNSYREPLQYAVRQMLNLATFELLAQVMSPESYADCREGISNAHGNLENSKSAKRVERYLAKKLVESDEAAVLTEDESPLGSQEGQTERSKGNAIHSNPKPVDQPSDELGSSSEAQATEQDPKATYKKYLD